MKYINEMLRGCVLSEDILWHESALTHPKNKLQQLIIMISYVSKANFTPYKDHYFNTSS